MKTFAHHVAARSAQNPIHAVFLRPEAISSVIYVIENQRDIKWTDAQRHLPKFYICIGKGGDFMEVI